MPIVIFLLMAASVQAADWPSYRGPNGSGAGDSLTLSAEFGRDKQVLWKQATPKGNSSPIVVKGRVLITAWEGDQRLVLCYQASTGRELWRASYEKLHAEIYNPQNGPTTPSPASDGDNAYVFLPEAGLISLTLDGKERWRVRFGPFSSIQGIAVSPVVADGLVFLLIDQPDDAYVAAYDAATGKERWKAKRPAGFLGSYSTPVVYRPSAGPAQLVVAGARELTGYQLRTGERLWWASGVTVGPAAMPVLHDDTVYTLEPMSEGAPPFKSMLGADKNKDGKLQLNEYGDSLNDRIMFRLMGSIDRNSGDNNGEVTEQEWNEAFGGSPEAKTPRGGGLVATRLGGKGDISSAIRWRASKGIPYITSALIHQGLLYVIRENGVLTSFDPATGEVRKQARIGDGGEYWASPVGADGKLILASKEGKVTLVRAGADWEPLATADFDEKVVATPAISAGRLFLRTESAIYCFGKAG